MKQGKILLLDINTTSSLCQMLQEAFESSVDTNVQLNHGSFKIDISNLHPNDLSKIISGFNPDMIFLVSSCSLLNQAGTLLQSIRKEFIKIPVVLVTDACPPDEVFDLLELGATDFITPPFKSTDILPRIWRVLEQNTITERTHQTLMEKIGLQQIIGESPAFLAEIRKIPLVAKSDATVLITGETGTGKEVCARAIHYLCPRTDKPFIPVNCGAIPAELMENELFGHKPGAFTSATSSQPGLIQEATGGTIFLDEIDCLAAAAQAKLLRFLQEKEYRPLGSPKVCKADVRVIAASNINLEDAVKSEKFRQDLYYRLNIIRLLLPPLRERRDDIPLLARHFLFKYADEYNKQVTEFSPDALQLLMFFDWPGNVRELEHVIERAVALSDQSVIRKEDIVLPSPEPGVHGESFQEAKDRVIAQFEIAYIQSLLLAHHGNITKAAEAAKKNRRAFWQLIHKHHINPENYKTIPHSAAQPQSKEKGQQ
ncbi:MAG: sigma-54-dependent Fis family transcriptional regulator [Candidatus Brocadia sp.]|nr:sigma-54-dependent Fis family transcriptional regulator [Candidatus Brocadia sp.]